MTLDITLLGHPSARREGTDVPLRGHKAWALLAYLLLSDHPVERTRLASLLFPDASDPAGALRWNLSQLRRALGVTLEGDPVVVELGDDAQVDVLTLRDGDAETGALLGNPDGELLAGLDLDADPAFATWLDGQRRRLRRLGIDVRSEAALARLGRGDTAGAVALAQSVVEADPFDENAGALLARCLHTDGRVEDARRVADETARRLRTELGVEPTRQLWDAVASPAGGNRRARGAGAVLAQLDAGEAAVAAGAIDTGLGSLRSATVAARALGDDHLLARSLAGLGTALIHGVRGVDQEGLALLHEAEPLAEALGDAALAALIRREIGYVDFLRARYDRAQSWFRRSREAAGGDRAARAWTDLFAAAARDDVGDVEEAARLLDAVEEAAAADGDIRLGAFAATFRGRQELLGGDFDAAVSCLEAGSTAARRIGWTAFLGFPESLLADARRRRGDLAGARRTAEHALVLSEQVGDPCWESLSLRSLGLVTVDEGRVEEGLALLADAPVQCRRLPDTYLWVEAYGIDGLADAGVRRRLPEAATWVDQLAAMAAEHGMRPLGERAQRHRDRLAPAAVATAP